MKPASLLFKVVFIISFFACEHLYADIPPSAEMVRTRQAPDINGNIDDEVWIQATAITNFRQYMPVLNAEPGMPTKVMLLYDDEAIYVAAEMTDPFPDSIAHQLGERDNEDLNADYFGIGFDTYNNQQDAYYYLVSASGIQVDGRVADETFDAVWESAVKITGNGWNVEMRIPYSALRFPVKETQQWGFQAIRRVRRNREEVQWALEEKGAGSRLVYWGKLNNIKNIKPPVRLSFTPYVSASIEHNSVTERNEKAWSGAYNGGMDVKYGINESFTMDMILLPDFSQVQSDRLQKNLTALELIYDENRTFFNEGTDLFQKGNLFYSRRIGRTPLRYYSVNGLLEKDETVTQNPLNARLLNAVKVSGRTAGGTGIGIFNALTGNTWATATDSLTGAKREILTDPVTNYNIVVIDQALPNNSSVYVINSNVTRPSGWDDSNVNGAGANIGNKTKTYFLGINVAASKWNNAGSEALYSSGEKYTGYNYGISFMKSRGRFQFSIYQSALDKHFNINDLGINRTRNQENRGFYVSYRIYEPFSIFMNFSQSFGFDQTRALDNKKNINTTLTYKGNTTLKNYFSTWWGLTISPYDRHDFYEPRRSGRYYLAPGYTQGWLGFSSDYRKTFALDGEFYYTVGTDNIKSLWVEISPIIRFNDRFSVRHETGYGSSPDDPGYVSQNNETIWFGRRDIITLENSFSGKYMVSRRIALSLWLRHYWQKAEYNSFYSLNENGGLIPDPEYNFEHNYNYNSFNIDFVMGWEFAPGSMLSIVWKNAIEREDDNFNIKFFDNLHNLYDSPQLNMFSIKILYHLDYLQLKRKKHESANH